MKFNGSAPETVNGRLAMLGFLIAAHEEAQTGHTIVYQFLNGPWQHYLMFAVFVYASMVPIMKGVKNEAFGTHTSQCSVFCCMPSACSLQEESLMNPAVHMCFS
jgi:hypothetical protein